MSHHFNDYIDQLVTLSKTHTLTEISTQLRIPKSTVRLWLVKLEVVPLRGKTGREVYQFQRDFFHLVDSEEKAYWLGFLYADGNVSGYKVRITLAVKDIDHLTLFRDALQHTAPIRRFMRETGERCYFGLTSVEMVQDLHRLGVVENKTFQIGLPSIEQHLMRHFVRGFFDGDGCVMSRRDTPTTYVLGYTPFLEQLIQWLGVPITLRQRKDKDTRLSYWQTYGETSRHILRILYEGCSVALPRKKLLADYWIGH
jgi:hypothetical protein